MNMKSALCGLIGILAFAAPASAGALDGLRPEHPRVLATEADFTRVRQLVKEDELAKKWFARLHERGERLLKRPVAKYELRDGKRLLFVSRDVLELVETLGLLYQIEGDPRYVQRVWAEVEAVCSFKNWNPGHFLDVGEMTFAVGLAYDWLYDQWTDEQRRTIREAMVRLGLKPSIEAFENGAWWTKTTNNWAQVCNGGLMAAALAIGDEEPMVAEQVMQNGLGAMPRTMARYAPDGGYEEGSGYWAYGTGYNVILLAALESALGHDFHLGEAEGFDVTGHFVPYLTGPSAKSFNFADSDEKTVRSPALFYFARRYGDTLAARYAMKTSAGTPFDLLWYRPGLLKAKVGIAPLDACYSSIGVITMRTAWDDPEAAFAGIKGGQNGVSHGQLDLGSFVYEAKGERWFVDLGRDDYNLPGYFDAGKDGMRWKYYRNRAEGHNTLVVHPGPGLDQPLNAVAPVELDGTTARVDMSGVNGPGSERQFTLDRSTGKLTVTDRLAPQHPADAWWFAHTRAAVQLADDGRTARLLQNGKHLVVRVIKPVGARFEVMGASPLPDSPNPPGQNPNNGAKLLNSSQGTSLVHTGNIPRWGKPHPSRAIRKLALHLKAEDETAIVVEIAAR